MALSSLRENIGRRSLARHKQSDKSETLKLLKDVREVGLVYDVQKSSVQTLNKLTHYFEAAGSKVFTIGFVDEKELGSNNPTSKDFFFCKKDLNLWKVPKNKAVNVFTKMAFDYLINLDMVGRNEMQAISTFSNAKVRVGRHIEQFCFAHEFMVEVSSDKEEELFQEIKKYIK